MQSPMLVLSLGAVLVAAACRSPRLPIEPVETPGSYSARLPGLGELELVLGEGPGGHFGAGRLDGTPVTFVEDRARELSGVLLFPDGARVPVVLRTGDRGPAGTGGRLVVALDRGDSEPTVRWGEKSGEWVASGPPGAVEAMHVVQHDAQLVGSARVLGEVLTFTGTSIGGERFIGELGAEDGTALLVTGRWVGSGRMIIDGYGELRRISEGAAR